MKLGIIGGGAWGTALAQIAAQGSEEVLLWAHEADVVASINESHSNPAFLPGVTLSPHIIAVAELSELAETDVILVVCPAQHLRATLATAQIGSRTLVLCAKGIEAETMMLMSDVARATCPDAPIAVLSGPTFAGEVARGMPTAVTLASDNMGRARMLAERLARPHFRPYVSTDVVGAEIGGAVKNVLAIACGVVEGRGLGQNARAALIARGFAEMTRYGLARGAQSETLAGLSGLGDLVLTCSSTASRNFTLGKGLGEGKQAVELLSDRTTVAEGAFTAPVLLQSARALNVDMPVVEAVCAILADEMPANHAIERLLARPLRDEG
jgi:glycerol-3-phosphate dehydrogenase (NAD(P)+)